jgi:hypothetical protein
VSVRAKVFAASGLAGGAGGVPGSIRVQGYSPANTLPMPRSVANRLEHFSYCCRALKGSLNQAFASAAVSSGSSSAMA